MKIASSKTVEGLTKLINAYFYSDKYSVNGAAVLKSGTPMPSMEVKKVKGRYVFIIN